MFKTLHKIKDEVAQKLYDCTFIQSISFLPEKHVIEMLDEVAKRYAEDVLKEVISKSYIMSDSKQRVDLIDILNTINELK